MLQLLSKGNLIVAAKFSKPHLLWPGRGWGGTSGKPSDHLQYNGEDEVDDVDDVDKGKNKVPWEHLRGSRLLVAGCSLLPPS